MLLLDALQREHVRIEATLDAMRTYVARRARGEAPRADAARFVRFFRLYADRFHHAREEGVLFDALARELELPTSRGPIFVLGEDHRRMRAMLSELEGLLDGELDPAGAERASALFAAYGHALSLHIDAENSVLFPESAARLVAAGVLELPDRAPTDDEAAAADDGDALAAVYPPSFDPAIVRGEGCVICPNFGAPCEGVEREWWSDEEWDEFPDHVG